MAAGMGIATLGFLPLTWVASDDGLAILVAGFTVGLFGCGLPGGLGINMIVGSAPPEKAGSASAISETGQELGIAFGFATLGSLGTAVYRGQLAETIPAGVPSRVAETAREGLAGAVAAAGQLPDPLGAGLLEASREAFTAVLNSAAGVGAAVYVVLAILAAVALRHVPPTGEAQPEDVPAADHDLKEAPPQASK